MFKFTLKLTLLSLVLAGAIMSLSNSKASAATCNWAPGNPKSPPAMGYHHGELEDNFAGLVVKAYVGSMTNGQPDDSDHGGQLVNTGYQLHSSLPAPGSGNHYYNPGGSSTYNYNARIFAVDSSGNPYDRTDTRTFRTGETLYSPNSSFSCDGFSALGPGTSFDEIGNRFGMDCGQEVLRDGTNAFVRKELTHYWISNIPNAFNQDGHWDIQIKDKNGTVTNVYRNGDMSSNAYFQVANGDTKYIDLVWHKEPRKTYKGGNDFQGTCEQTSVSNFGSGNSNRRRVYVEITGISLGRLRVFDKDGNLNQQDVYPSWPGDPARPRSVAAWVGSGGSPPAGDKGIGPGENGQTKIWNYIPWDSNSIHIKVEVQDLWDNDGDGNKTWNTVNIPGVSYNDTIPCYTATCNIASVTGDGPGGIVTAGGTMHIHATLTNTSRDNLQLWNPPLSDGGGNLYGSDVVLDPGDTHDYYIDNRAPPNAGYYDYAHGFVFYPVYFGRAGNDCSGSVAIYEHFILDPHSTLTYATAENPGTIGYSAYVNNNSSADVSAPSTSSFTSTPYGGGTRCANAGPVNTNGPYHPGGPNYTISPSSCSPSQVAAGDTYCSRIDLSYNSGYVGPGGVIVGAGVDPGTPISDLHCFTVINKPYFKAYGGAVSAGGNFKQADGTCNSGSGGLLAGWNDNSGGQARGASSQLSALAFIKITGFASAQASASTSSPPGTALSFANTQLPSGGQTSSSVDSPTLGGNYNPGGSRCLTDVTPPSGQAAQPDGYVQPGISGISDSQSVFVDGDVYINGNITYANNWTAGSKPSFVLRATGNIYIAPGVTELDGLYIGKNRIYTCASNNGGGNFTPMSGTTLYTNCNKQLVVYGSFVSQQVNLMRTYGSLRNATSGELTTAGSHSCSYSGGPGNSPVCAGEVFIFSPALYMTNPAIRPPSNGATQYDAITSLPPVL